MLMWGFLQAGISRVMVSVRGPCDLGYKSWFVGYLPVGKNHMILGSFVLTHYHRVEKRHADYS